MGSALFLAYPVLQHVTYVAQSYMCSRSLCHLCIWYVYIYLYRYILNIFIYIHISFIHIYLNIFIFIDVYFRTFSFGSALFHDVSDIILSYCMLNPACKVSNTSQAFLVFLVSGPHVDEWKSYGAFRDFYEEELEGGSTFLEDFDMKILDDFNMFDSELCKSLFFWYFICSGCWNRFVSLDPIFVV